MFLSVSLRVDAVSSGEDPLLAEDGAAADVAAILAEGYLQHNPRLALGISHAAVAVGAFLPHGERAA